MSIVGPRRWLALLILVGAGGCASVPAGHKGSSSTDSDPYEGWLSKSLTGQKIAPSQAAPAAANSPAADAAGPLMAGPSSATRWSSGVSPGTGTGVVPVSGELPAPPPSIPAELPAPAAAVSIQGVKPAEEEKKKGFELSDLVPENVWKSVKKATGHQPDEKIARAAKAEGEKLFREKKYAEAAVKFAEAADRWPDSPLEEDALFLQGESEFFADQYPKAHDTYGGLLKKYPNPRHLDVVMARQFAIGRYWEQLYTGNPTWPTTPNLTDNSKPLFDTFGYAVQAYERIRMHDPTGPLADASVMALGNAYFRRGQFITAAQQYDTLIKEYANSKYQMNAHLLDLQAKMRIYQGAEYDDTPLKDAKKLADQTLKQFGPRLGADRQRTARAYAQIVEEQAGRDFLVAEYYERRGYYGAARFTLKGVMDDYPGTAKAEEARAAMEKIRNEPDEPPNRFAWLTGLFESKKR